MITKEETKALKKIIGPRHLAQISGYLNENNIFNRYDEPFSTIFISRVFNGGVENKLVERHIWDYVEKKKKDDEEEEERKKEILQS